MKYIFPLFGLFFILPACERHPVPTDTAGRLKSMMAAFLKKAAEKESTPTRFDVQDVTFFQDSTFFECEFKVRMIQASRDTTGIMNARIAADFSKVVRKE